MLRSKNSTHHQKHYADVNWAPHQLKSKKNKNKLDMAPSAKSYPRPNVCTKVVYFLFEIAQLFAVAYYSKTKGVLLFVLFDFLLNSHEFFRLAICVEERRLKSKNLLLKAKNIH